jgi:hypothetical protein
VEFSLFYVVWHIDGQRQEQGPFESFDDADEWSGALVGVVESCLIESRTGDLLEDTWRLRL